MTAFLFIPATRGARRVDFATLASLFAEAEEPLVRPKSARNRAARLATAALILIGIVGDTCLIARPKMLVDVFATTLSTPGTPRAV